MEYLPEDLARGGCVPRGEPRRVRDYCSQFREWKTRGNQYCWGYGNTASIGEKYGKKFARFGQEALVKRGMIGRSFWTHIEGSCATRDVGDKAGGGLDIAGSTDGHEDSAIFESCKDLLQMKWRFAEPTDMGADLAAAGAER